MAHLAVLFDLLLPSTFIYNEVEHQDHIGIKLKALHSNAKRWLISLYKADLYFFLDYHVSLAFHGVSKERLHTAF